MTLLDIAAVLLTLAAVIGYVNHRFFKLPATIGLMAITLACSAGLMLLDRILLSRGIDSGISPYIGDLVGELDFSDTLLKGMLSFLLFAGALHVNLDDLLRRRWAIGTLATAGVAISAAVVGGLSFLVFGWIGFSVPFVVCLVFGTLISPTDPVAVLGVLKTTKASASLEAKIAGESLFNDGIGIVAFILVTSLAGLEGEAALGPGEVALLFLQEAVGGALLGLVLGYLAYRAMRSIDHYQVEITITLALVMAANSIAAALHMSGPIAVVVAGLLIGNRGRRLAMSDEVTDHLEKFWSLIDDILNAVLFLLIGLEVFVISLEPKYLTAGLAAIPIVLAARFTSVSIPITLLKVARRSFSPRVIRILTWSGLRGGISVALVLSLPPFAHRNLLVTCTYLVVVFSVIVQGMTVKAVVRGGEE
jgi:CPA1 family monovalent cation:H+ antiporter